jgi:drug/metabolite transporter (DMT)-like permease
MSAFRAGVFGKRAKAQGARKLVIATLPATSPVIILPLLWLRTGQRPSAKSWLGAGLAVVGLALIFTRQPCDGARRSLGRNPAGYRRRSVQFPALACAGVIGNKPDFQKC